LKPLDPLSLILALGILLLAALFAAGIPARRASTLDPAETLRQE
jgi:ABC-type lipoprotein release transport system permease subunit